MINMIFLKLFVVSLLFIGSIGCAHGDSVGKIATNKVENINIPQGTISKDTVIGHLSVAEGSSKKNDEPKEESMSFTNWLTLIAILTALSGPYLFALVKRNYLKHHYNRALSTIVSDF